MRKLLASILLLLLTFASYAGDFFFQHIGLEDGLPQMSVADICQDRLGTMWFATRQGVASYNGHISDVFNPIAGDSTSLFAPVATRLATDSCDNIYIHTEGVNVYSRLSSRMSVVWPKVCSAMAADSNGLFFISFNKLYYYTAATGAIEFLHDFPAEQYDELCCIAVSGTRLLVATVTGDLYSVSLPKLEVVHIANLGSIVSCIYEDSRHTIWMGTWSSGLWVMTADRIMHYSSGDVLPSDFIRTVCEDADGTIWLGTDNGIVPFSVKGCNRVYLPGQSVWKMCKDRSGNLWIGTYFGGVFYFNPAFAPYRQIPLKVSPYPVISAVNEWGSSRYISTEGAGLLQTDNEGNVIRRWNLPNIKTTYFDREGKQLYVGTHLGGLYGISLPSGNTKHYQLPQPERPSSNIVRSVIPFAGQILVGTYNGLYTTVDNSNQLALYSKKLHRTISYIVDMTPDHYGHLWIGGYDLAEYIPASDSVRIVDKPFRNIEKLCVDHRGNIWIGTEGEGVWCYSPDSAIFTEYSRRSGGLQNDFIRNLQFTPGGDLMIITTLGYSILDLDTHRISNYPPGSSMPLTSLYNGGYGLSADGEIILAGMDGMIAFHENDLKKMPQQPSIVLNKLFVNAQEVLPCDSTGILQQALAFTERITLHHTQNLINIRLSVDNYANVDGQYLRYRVNRGNWITIPVSSEGIVLMNLPYGTNHLHFQAIDDTGALLAERSLAIRMRPPWYLSLFAITCYLILLLTALGWFIWWENKRVKKALEAAENAKDEAFRLKLLNCISAHIADPNLDVNLLCQELGLGRTRLFKLVKSAFQDTPQHLIQQQRLERAAQLLSERDDLNVSDIAYDLGYQSPKYFTKCFKDHFGIPPSQYRAKHATQ